MIQLDESIVEKIILDSEIELKNAIEFSSDNVEDVSKKIRIFNCGIV